MSTSALKCSGIFPSLDASILASLSLLNPMSFLYCSILAKRVSGESGCSVSSVVSGLSARGNFVVLLLSMTWGNRNGMAARELPRMRARVMPLDLNFDPAMMSIDPAMATKPARMRRFESSRFWSSPPSVPPMRNRVMTRVMKMRPTMSMSIFSGLLGWTCLALTFW